MKFLKLFLIRTFKNSNLAEKLKKISENLFFKVELHGVNGVCFFPSLPLDGTFSDIMVGKV